MAYNWTAGADYSPSGEWNAYNTYASGGSYQQPYTGFMSTSPTTDTTNSSSNAAPSGSYWTNAATGIGNYQQGYASGDSTSGAISGAASGYQSGGWTGAIVGALAGWYGGKEGEKDKNRGKLSFEQQMELELAQARYAEEVRQKKNKETADALAMYTAKTAPPTTYNYNNGLMSGAWNGAFSPNAQPTQPVVNPLANSYGLLRG